MRTSTGTVVTACALSAALLVAGCGADGDKDTRAGGELFLQPAAAQGPDPFTDSTVTSTATPSPITRTPQPAQSGAAGVRSVSGGTPGLYGGIERVGSCDVGRQVTHLTADRTKVRAFAWAAGISQASIPGYLRGLAPVQLRADTRVTSHGFRDGRATTFQSVLQAGTAVLVDNRGVPRVRCACGNPLAPPVAAGGNSGTSGRPWSGYRPAQVIVVAPAVQVITNITIINVVGNTWIERRIGHDVHHDRVVPSPTPVPPTPTPPLSPTPSPHDSASSASPREDNPFSNEDSPSPSDCATPMVTVTPGATDDVTTETPSTGPTDCPTATVTATPPTTEPESLPSDESTEPVPDPAEPDTSLDATDETGPEAVPEAPDLPDGGGLIPDDRATSDSILGSPTDVFDG
ncbi:hypothetical protein AQJ91_37335 [Streptomyces dysideae]|uniref:DUF6777 domain-containing protein n=1 Tax=Streptomyces dysideae TaxID=909626 RepID=A0A101USW3_9ACTN|nr:hypothetical protein AQJ91_37335 [Streptomyces dysideae]